jgi:hypothetical protein
MHLLQVTRTGYGGAYHVLGMPSLFRSQGRPDSLYQFEWITIPFLQFLTGKVMHATMDHGLNYTRLHVSIWVQRIGNLVFMDHNPYYP